MDATSTDTTDTKRVGIWIRVSTDDQAKGDSPEHHEKRARAYAEAKDWQVVELYDLSGVSGKSVMAHPEAKRMLSDVRKGHITGLIFSKLARLARNTRELLDFSDIFREEGADLVSLQDAIDTSSPAGRLFYTMLAAMATWEREEIAERVAVSVPIRAKLGKNVGGQASFGYQWKDNTLIPQPEEAPVRKLMYELFAEHKRKRTVARLLNDQGYRTRKGSEFTSTTIERLLRDPTAKGLHRANYTKSLGLKKRWEVKPQSDWIYTEVPAIVSAELWGECKAILDDQRRRYKPPSRKTVHLFSGLTFCSCGHKMYVPSNTPKYVCSKCRNKVPIVDLDGIFHEQLKHLFFSPSEVAEYLKQGNEVMREKEELLEVLVGEQRKISREMDKLYDLYMAEQITKEGFGERYHPLDQRLKQIEDQLPELQAQLDVMKIHYLSSDQIIAEARDLYTRWPLLPMGDKRSIVEAITESIVIGKDEVNINLCYLPPAPDQTRPPSGGEGGGGSNTPEDEPPQPHGGDNNVPQPFSSDKKLSHPYSKQGNGKSVTQRHGFMAATSWTREGYVTWALARATTIQPFSSGWRNDSSTARGNSGSSSRNRTPRCDSDISPGRARVPPPTVAAIDDEWCGSRNGLRRVRRPPVSSPATLWIMLTSSTSDGASGGSSPGRRWASIDLPAPGGPIISRLWPPAAVTSSARLAVSWPLMSRRSG